MPANTQLGTAIVAVGQDLLNYSTDTNKLAARIASPHIDAFSGLHQNHLPYSAHRVGSPLGGAHPLPALLNRAIPHLVALYPPSLLSRFVACPSADDSGTTLSLVSGSNSDGTRSHPVHEWTRTCSPRNWFPVQTSAPSCSDCGPAFVEPSSSAATLQRLRTRWMCSNLLRAPALVENEMPDNSQTAAASSLACYRGGGVEEE